MKQTNSNLPEPKLEATGPDSSPMVGISACLLGEAVRHDGGHTRSRYCTEDLAEFFSFQSFCPELEAGFGVPRPAMRLQGEPKTPRLVLSGQPQIDVTEKLQHGFEHYIPGLGNLDGYLLMRNSPSCGLERIKVYPAGSYDTDNKPAPLKEKSSGLFTQALKQQWPSLPLEEAGRLNDAGLRENFILRVFAHHRFRQHVLARPEFRNLLAFHSEYKYIVMAHDQQAYRELGRYLSDSSHGSAKEMIAHYFPRFMSAISKPATRNNHTNVLMHLLGYLKQEVSSTSRQDLLESIEQYRLGQVHLATPLTLLTHYLKQHGSEYVRTQRYLHPYPQSLGLRNEI